MKHQKRIVVVTIILATLVIFIAGGFLFFNVRRIKTYNQFVELYNTMSEGTIKAESADILICNVWRNNIWEKADTQTDKYTRKNGGSGKFYDDFNDALNNLFEDETFIDDLVEIYSLKTKAETLIKTLAKHPRAFDEEYSDFKDCYLMFVKFVEMPLSTEGKSLNSFTEEHNDLDTKLADKLRELDLYFE
ncbi:MAG: hypothetical protein IKS98_08610 [Lachnospiraceae bacterium]|nr:hypothetical protein [Lachnospiraceae bacterium]